MCAAVTISLRTVMAVLDGTEGIRLDTETAVRGRLAFSVTAYDGSVLDRLIFAGDFLRSGFRSLAEEFPENVILREHTEE